MSVKLMIGDCTEKLRELPDQSVNCCVTSPPYFGLRDYGVDGQLGAEASPKEYAQALTQVFREVWRVLRDDGTVWLNLGDSYNAYNGNRGESKGSANSRHHDIMPSLPQGSGLTAGSLKNKDLMGTPWRVAFALQDDGWYLRQDIIWNKPNPMPESVTDRCTKAHEYVFLLSKSPRYYYDAEAVKEPGTGEAPGNKHATKGGRSYADGDNKHRTAANLHNVKAAEKKNRRSVWRVSTKPYAGAHFATFPPALVEPCILAGCPYGGTVLDPFAGSGTTGYVADYLQRNAVLVELNPDYAELIRERMASAGMFNPLEVA